jgi:hypothetical protein
MSVVLVGQSRSVTLVSGDSVTALASPTVGGDADRPSSSAFLAVAEVWSRD